MLAGSIFECVSTPKERGKRLEHDSAWENASHSALSDLQQLGGPLNQNSDHTVDLEGDGGPMGSKVHAGSIFEYVGIPKGAFMLLEHKSALANASPAPLSDFPHFGGTQDQYSQHTSIIERLASLAAPINSSPDHEMEHWDIKEAFINAVLEEDIWIHQPDGHHQEGSKDMVCKLNKALYGLKQAGRAWQKLIKPILFEAGFTQLLKDEGAFVAHTASGGWCVIGTHVDDLFPLYNKEGRALRDRVFKALEKRVKVKNEGPVKWALKISIERDREAGVIKFLKVNLFERFFNVLGLMGGTVMSPLLMIRDRIR